MSNVEIAAGKEAAQPEPLASQDVLGLLMNSLNASLTPNRSEQQDKTSNQIHHSTNKSIYEELQMKDLKQNTNLSQRKT